MKKILITGISGFAGSFLADLLVKEKSYEVFGTSLTDDCLNLVASKENVHLRKINLLHRDDVAELIADIRPDQIFHLAALTAPSLSFKNPAETITNNVAAEIALLEAVRKQYLINTKILIVSSADVYGRVAQSDLPTDEITEFQPTNPYAVSKIAQDYLGLQYYNSYNLHIIRVRPFNHIGPRQAANFVVPDFAKQIAEVEAGKREPRLRVGNLSTKRDFTDVRDMVRAYVAILDKGTSGDVYNIGSGVSHTIQEILDILLSISTKQITVEKDPSLMRPSDNPEMLCDATKMKKITGWNAEIPLRQTLKDTLDYWRTIVVK